MANTPLEPKKIQVTFTVSNTDQAHELDAAWHEIVTGKRLAHAEALEHSVEGIMERARVALEVIETSILRNPTTGQSGRLVRFLAALYNGYDFSFDLTELRALDMHLANACLDYLNYDRLAKQEVHKHLSGGDRELWSWIRDYRVEPRLSLASKHADAFAELQERTERSPNELLREAVDLLLDKHHRRDGA